MNCYGSLYTNLLYRIIFLAGGARAVTGMWKSIPIEILLVEANLRTAKVVLDAR